MRKFFLLIILVGLHPFSNAQINVGGGLSFGSKIETIGLNLRAGYLIEDHFNVGVDFNFFTPNRAGVGRLDWSEFNLNVDYWFTITEEIHLYPLVGVNLTTIRASANFAGFNSAQRRTKLGLNIGGGFMYNIGKIAPYFEAKYVISEFDQAVIGLGVIFKLD